MSGHRRASVLSLPVRCAHKASAPALSGLYLGCDAWIQHHDGRHLLLLGPEGSRGGPLLHDGGKLQIAQQMANHESARTFGLCDWRTDQVNLDKVERILV